jgi:hypothetical protein
MKRLLHKAPTSREDQPLPDWVTGRCPCCGSETVRNLYYVGGKSYVIIEACWQGLGSHREPTCTYRRILP